MIQQDRCRDGLPFLDIPDPDNDLWLNFRFLGVTIDLNLEYFLEYLIGIQGESLTTSAAHGIYRQMNMCVTAAQSVIR